MKCFLTVTPLGVIALNEKGVIIESISIPRDPREVADRLLKLEAGKSFKELSTVVKKLKAKGYQTIVVDNAHLVRIIKDLGVSECEVSLESPLSAVKEDPLKFSKYLDFEGSWLEYASLLREVGIFLSREKVRRKLSERDKLIIYAIRCIETTDEYINEYAMLLREWYFAHFPEITELVSSHTLLSRLIAEVGSRENFTIEKLRKLGIDSKTCSKLVEAAEKSIGAEICDEDLNAMSLLADRLVQLHKLRQKLESYISRVIKDICPNTSSIVSPLLAAKLISLAGGLDRLARMPASTIQVLGAQKALFRYLSGKGKPPKHGVLFQAKEVRSAPKSLRGKIARLLAAKIAIAARIDYFSGEDKSEELVKDLKEKLRKIKEEYHKQRVSSKKRKR